MTLMRKLTLNFCHSQTHDLVKVKVTGSVQPMGLATSGCSPSHIVLSSLSDGVMSDEYAQAPPGICQHSGASPLVGDHPDCKT